LFLGKPGCGKSHLAIALGIRALEAGYRGYFTTATDMVAAMTTAYADGSFNTKIRTYTGPSVLVINDVGITPFDRAQANAFFQVVNRRYEKRSATIVTTNRGLPAWAELFGGDAVAAAAILDRLLDGGAVINIKGPSWRLREHQALTQPLAQLNDPPEPPSRTRRSPHPGAHPRTATFDEQKARRSMSADRRRRRGVAPPPPLAAIGAHCLPGRGSRFNGPNSSMQITTLGSLSPGSALPSAMS
jgi:hypothetical protein